MVIDTNTKAASCAARTPVTLRTSRLPEVKWAEWQSHTLQE